MNFKINSFPSFITKGAKILAGKWGSMLTDFAIDEFEILQKKWMFEVLAELQQPEEATQLFYTRQQAIERLNVGLTKFQNLEKSGLLKRHYIGPMPIFFEQDLLNAITEEKTLEFKNNNDED